MNSTESTVQESNINTGEISPEVPLAELVIEKDLDATTDPLIRNHFKNLFDDWKVIEEEEDGCDSYGSLYWVTTKYWTGRSYNLESEMRKYLGSHFDGILKEGHVFLKDYDDIEHDTRRFYTKESLERIYREFWDKYDDDDC